MYIREPTYHSLGQSPGLFVGTFTGTIRGDKESAATIKIILTDQDNMVTGQIALDKGLKLALGGFCLMEDVDLSSINISGRTSPDNPRYLQASVKVTESPVSTPGVKSVDINVTIKANLSNDGNTIAAEVTFDPLEGVTILGKVDLKKKGCMAKTLPVTLNKQTPTGSLKGYIYDRPSQRYYLNQMQGLEGSTTPQRIKIKAADVPVQAVSPASERIAKAVRTAVANMSRSYDITEQNTAQRIVNGDVAIRFVTSVMNPEPILKVQGMSEADIMSKLKTNVLWNMPGRGLVLVSKRNIPRASEDNGVVYVPTDSSEPNLTIDLIHEINHAMNPILIKEQVNPREYLWEKFNQEARAKYAADCRNVKGLSDKSNISLREERAIELAREQATIRGWTSRPEWDAAFESRVSSWRPNGNLDNHK